MRTGRLLERIDLHLEGIQEEIRLTREEVSLSRQSREDLRAVIQEQTRRMERAAEEQSRGLSQVLRDHENTVRALDDMRDQIRADTQAVLRALDRRPGNGGAAEATS